MSKKAQINQLSTVVTALVAVAIVLTVSFLLYSQVKTQSVSMAPITNTSINESVSWVNATNVSFAECKGCCMTVNCVAVINETGGVGAIPVIHPDNYTCSTDGIEWHNTTDETLPELPTVVNVTYTYQPCSKAYNATGTIQNATQDIPAWLPIIVVTIIGGLLIGLVAFFRGRA